jgi:hypothetical protein
VLTLEPTFAQSESVQPVSQALGLSWWEPMPAGYGGLCHACLCRSRRWRARLSALRAEGLRGCVLSAIRRGTRSTQGILAPRSTPDIRGNYLEVLDPNISSRPILALQKESAQRRSLPRRKSTRGIATAPYYEKETNLWQSKLGSVESA